jgi:hypothetical protein
MRRNAECTKKTLKKEPRYSGGTKNPIYITNLSDYRKEWICYGERMQTGRLSTLMVKYRCTERRHEGRLVKGQLDN